ncbi:MAG TPA: glycosyltransferase [Thermoanaerobaculia bacterium]|nr:glycosyltransferase [Thermoanaerobaculia bacterium]
MKVLMLGWEFPPHISGGLGTACFGLVGGLRHHDVDVVFVVPHVFGDEDTSSVRLLGTQSWERQHGVSPASGGSAATAAAPEAAGPAGARAPRNGDAVVGDAAAAPAEAAALRVLGIDSALRPYLGPEEYTERVRRVEEGADLREPALSPPADPGGAPRATHEREPDPGGSPPAPRPRAAEPPGPISLGVQSKIGRYHRDLFAEVARYSAVCAGIAAREPHHLVHAHDWMTFSGGIAAARTSGKPLVVHVHSSEYDRSGEGANPRILEIEQAGVDAADRVICVSHYTACVVKARYGVDERKIRVVHNAVTRREQRLEWHQEKAIENPVVLFLGRVTFQKGPDYFLQAAALVAKEEPSARFVLGGSGDMLPRMIETAAQLGLARHVFFTGFLTGDDVERMYAMADIYVMPSVSEPFGIAPLEAMALDVPVIVSRQSGVAEVLQHALKVDFWDVRDIAEKILALLRRPALRRSLVESGREEVARMSWDLRGQLMRDLYQELLA